MAIRPREVLNPPHVEDPKLAYWMRKVSEAINSLPISVFSTSGGPNASNVTAPEGFLGIEVGSSKTRLWVKTGSGATLWSALSHIAY